MVQVHIEIATCGERNRIDVRFPYSETLLERMRTIGGRSFVKTPTKHWHVPLDMESCRMLRVAFGADLVIGPELKQWATQAVREEGVLGSLALADTAPLEQLEHVLPMLYQAVHLGPLGRFMTDAERTAGMAQPPSYQAADVAFLATSKAPLNGNEQGLGKTPEWIATVWEAGIEEGCHLVIAPKAAVDGTWEVELALWQKDAPKGVEIFCCVDDRGNREATLKAFANSVAPVKWVVVNPAMVQYVKDPMRTSRITVGVTGTKAQMVACYCKARKGAHEHYVPPYAILHDTAWTTICIDEAHKGSVRNHKSITSKSIRALTIIEGGKPCIMTGTPMKKHGGSDIWGMLNFLRPDVFTSFWRMAENYFEIEVNDYGKKVKELRPEMAESFFRMLQPYVLRRTKAEAVPWLPPKHYIPVRCVMGERQRKQYEDIEKRGSTSFGDDDYEVNIKGVLDEFVRLKQFANAFCKVDKDGAMVPVESCKVDAMLEKMDECGMFDEGATKKQLVFSQSRQMIEFTAAILRKRGLKVDIISGKINKSAERMRIKDQFQNGDTRVLCIVTTAGGVSLTLDMADDVHLLDEMWSPDEDAQAEDRAHRVSRVHQVTVYIYRTDNTVDSYIQEVKEEKLVTHQFILDVRRKIVAKWKK